jgi:AraC-like DNA-binding protein
MKHPDRRGRADGRHAVRAVRTEAVERVATALVDRRPASTVRSGGLDALCAGLDRLLATEDPDLMLRRAVELARDEIGLVRTAIHVLDGCKSLMFGSWASDAQGQIVDEHHVVYAISARDRVVLRPDEAAAHYEVFKRCLIVEHRTRGTDVAASAWVAITPIRCGRRVVGVMVNDAGPSETPFAETKQALAAILCSVLGPAFAARRRGTEVTGVAVAGDLPVHRLVTSTLAMLAQDPGVTVNQIARRLAVGPRRLKGLFEASLGVSFAQYHDRVRLDRLAFLVARGGTTLPEAAVAAGFESYGHLRRVVVTSRWNAVLDRCAG